MKKIILLSALSGAIYANAQFSIDVSAPDTFSNKEVVVYTLNGSKDVLTTQAQKKQGKWHLKISEPYKGMLKIYFPENQQSINFISENKNVAIQIDAKGREIQDVIFLDEANRLMQELSKIEQKKQRILPALEQIKTLYNDGSEFDNALKQEIARLNQSSVNNTNLKPYDFINYYFSSLKYAEPNDSQKLSTADYANFLANSNELLETSSLLKPILLNFLRSVSKDQATIEIDKLLDNIHIESPRGQNILAELLDIFETYGLEAEKEKYYKLATNLKCSINSNLERSLTAIKNTAIGSVFPDYAFTSEVKNTKAKTLSKVKSNKKLVLFWASTCPHCMSELPKILENYPALKKQNIEVIAFSLDKDKASYQNAVGSLPWINDSELKGWNSSYAERYNVHATPTYFVLDENDKIIAKPIKFKDFLENLNSTK